MTTEPTGGADAIDRASAAFWQPADLHTQVLGAEPLTAAESFVIPDLTDDEWESVERAVRELASRCPARAPSSSRPDDTGVLIGPLSAAESLGESCQNSCSSRLQRFATRVTASVAVPASRRLGVSECLTRWANPTACEARPRNSSFFVPGDRVLDVPAQPAAAWA